MKKIKYYTKAVLLSLFALICLTGCEEDESFPTFPAPTWKANSSLYSTTMTAVVQLPPELIQYYTELDQLAVFAGEVCRGTAVAIDGLFFVTIYGTPDDHSKLYFQYYNARNKYLYETKELFSFESDMIYGVMDEPEVLSLTIKK